jgi:endogenous inhibitor of DNA gyrase (YacG/DUF329 family)
MSARDPILAAACRRTGCAGAAQDRHDGYCSERCRKRDQDGGNGDTLVGDGGVESLERNCPWCGHDTLVRADRDERCTRDDCEYHVQGRFGERDGDA